MKITANILDDEFAAAENIKILLSNYCPEITILGIAHSISEGIKMVKNDKPDLVFLDISMPPEGTGFDFLEMFPNRDFHVIFVTAYEQYSLKALKEHAFDYILKPIDFKDLIKSIDQFKSIHFRNNNQEVNSAPKTITLSTDQGVHVVRTEEILFCKASGSYTEFHISGRSPVIISKPLKYAESILTSNQFKRVHRSYLINSEKISKFTKEDGGFVYIGNEVIPVSKKYYDNLYDLIS